MTVPWTKIATGDGIRKAIEEALKSAPSHEGDEKKFSLKVHWESSEIQIQESAFREVNKTTTSIGKTPKELKRPCQDFVAENWSHTGSDVLDAIMEFLDTQYNLDLDNQDRSYSIKLNWDEQYAQYTAEITGTHEDVRNITEQLAWMTATFRNSNDSTNATSKVYFSWTKKRSRIRAEIKPLPLDSSPETNPEKLVDSTDSPQYIFEYEDVSVYIQPKKENQED
ncbi:hypothetical protein J3458_020043 [Metarhizium acridum]|uniref:uncharacterized protein n=1 Tax=Metarhizium acridum TaxID=92637 RepID=UPI001C6AE541|nr:hypothetical protein J3458_020043 [Metarhizium acridum]